MPTSNGIQALLLVHLFILGFTEEEKDNDQQEKLKNIKEMMNPNHNQNNYHERWGKGYATHPTMYTSRTPPVSTSQGNDQASIKEHVSYKVLAERGLTLERKGTLISYSSIDLMSVVIRIPTIDESKFPANCSIVLQPLKHAYTQRMTHYKDLLQTILKPSIKVSKKKLCDWTGGVNCDQFETEKRNKKKRFVAEAMAATALVISAAALGLAIDNHIQLKHIESYLNEIAEDLETVTGELLLTNERQEKFVRKQQKILGYISEINEHIETLGNMVECNRLSILYSQWTNEILQKLDDILTYPRQGKVGGSLFPTIISPEGIAHTISQSASHSMKQILSHLPTIFYSSAHATLIGYDLDNLVFQFLITYPLLESSSTVLPIFNTYQAGFYSSIQNNNNTGNETECIKFQMPHFATQKNGNWYTLTLSDYHCPIVGDFSICPDTAFSLKNLNSCININLNDDTTTKLHPHGCTLETCATDSEYVNLRGGLMLRSIQQDVSLLYNQNGRLSQDKPSARNEKVSTNPQGTLWVPWTENLTAVQFHDRVVYNPMDKQFQASIEEFKIQNISDIMTLAEIFDTNFESSRMGNELQRHQKDLDMLGNEIFQSNSILEHLGGFSKFMKRPMRYMKLPFIITGGIVGFLLISFLLYKYCYPKCHPQTSAMNYRMIQMIRSNYQARTPPQSGEEHQLVAIVTPNELNNISAHNEQPKEASHTTAQLNNITASEQENPYSTLAHTLQQINSIDTTNKNGTTPTFKYIQGTCYK